MEDAKINIKNLEEERENLKTKRPSMLAENQDISKLNQRLKDIDDEIEINKYTISGVEVKIKEVHNKELDIRQEANVAYQKYIRTILSKVSAEYMKIAPKLVDIIKDYIVLEHLRDGDGFHYECFPPEVITRLPNLEKSNSNLFYNNYYSIIRSHIGKVKKKYAIIEFNVSRVSASEYQY